MKSIVLFLVIAISSIGCKEYEEIQFIGLQDVKVNGIKGGNLLISTNAAFHNAEVTNIDKISVAPSSKFLVPLSMGISISKLQTGLLSNLASLIRKKSVELEFKGNIKVASFGFTQTIPVSYKEDIEF